MGHASSSIYVICTYLYISILYIYNIHIRLHLLPICTPVLLIILASIGYYCILLWWLASYPLMLLDLLGDNMPHAACLNIDDFVTSIRDPCPHLCLLRSQAHPFPHRLLWPESAELIVHLLALTSCWRTWSVLLLRYCTDIVYIRMKFRSQTSDNMDRWKAEQGRGREKRKLRREKIREEKE